MVLGEVTLFDEQGLRDDTQIADKALEPVAFERLEVLFIIGAISQAKEIN